MLKLDTRKLFLFGAVIGLLIFLHFTRILKPIENAIVFIFKPFTSGVSSMASGIHGSFQEREDKEALIEKVTELEKERNQLLSENANLKIIEEENKELKKHLNFLSENKHKYVLANVIAKGSFLMRSENEQIIIIDKGSKDGILPGLPLVNSEGMIVGKVFNVKDNLSEAYLTTDSNCKLAAMVHVQKNTTGVVSGELGLTIRMDFIPQAEIIFPGSTVITSGLEEKIPKGLVIGKVAQVHQDNNEIWQNAVIEPIINLDNLSVLSVLLP